MKCPRRREGKHFLKNVLLRLSIELVLIDDAFWSSTQKAHRTARSALKASPPWTFVLPKPERSKAARWARTGAADPCSS